MKKVHLLCNAHLDPVWQWEWEEGASAALSTFCSAEKLLNEFDYVFCHNEVTLYEYVRKYTPELFSKIQAQVECGKWHIMGAWFLQPDCNMPSGESIVRQIQVGRKYFKEYFNKAPTTAINFDPFGHNIGLVQIMKKCGYDSYIFMRPEQNLMELPSEQFIWHGLDGSEIKAVRVASYGSPLGGARKWIERRIDEQKEYETGLVLWGVGNHGGGPSRKDLRDIEQLMKDSDFEIVHSTPEQFFAEISPSATYEKSLRISMPGCYTSMIRLKQKHIELENQLFFTEKLCSIAVLNGVMEYPQEAFDRILRDLLNSEFHDILPGTCIEKGEANGFQFLEHGLRELNEIRAQAFFALSSNQPQAAEGEYPILVFNPYPYEITTNVEVEFSLADSNWEDNITNLKIFDGERELKAQIIKEDSNLNLDWRKRLICEVTLPPMQIKRLSIFEMGRSPKQSDAKAECFVYEDANKYVEINKQTGLLSHYTIHGKEYLNGEGFLPFMYEDVADPWGSLPECQKEMGKNPVPFELMQDMRGAFKGLKSVEVIENGEIYLGIESFFECESTQMRIEYRIYKNSVDVDVLVDVFMQDVDKLVKLHIPVAVQGDYVGQCSFGTDTLLMNGQECVSQRFVAVKQENDECLAIFNKSNYATSYKDGVIRLNLVRGAGYCVLPIEWPIGTLRELTPNNRYIRRMDQGKSSFSFRLSVCKENELERKAQEFNQMPYALNVFPIGNGKEIVPIGIQLSNCNIVLITMKKSECKEGYIVRLLNNCSKQQTTDVQMQAQTLSLTFGPYEVKTLLFNGTLEEMDELLI